MPTICPLYARGHGTDLLLFLLSFVQKAKVTVHKCAGIIRTRLLFKGGPYMRKYGIYNDFGLRLKQPTGL